MKKVLVFLCYILSLLLLAFLMNCQTPSPKDDALKEGGQGDSVQIIVSLADISESSGGFDTLTTADDEILLGFTEAGQWIGFNIEVAVAGRYRCEVIAGTSGADQGTVWIEDYVGNPDERTYNISGDIAVGPMEGDRKVARYHRDGSPLDTGMHPIRLHVRNAGVYVQALKFTLLKAHQITTQQLTQQMAGSEWNLVWSDEFEGSGLPDTSKWIYDIGDWGWGNNELQYYTEARAGNARLENGNLIIEARKQDHGHAWTSARLTTRGKTSFVYGKIEIRAKVPAQRGNWSAGWLLGDAYVDEKSWPYCGEVDILECVGYEMQNPEGDGIAHASVHCGAYYFKLGNQPTATTPVDNMSGEYHSYTLVWRKDQIEMFVDDKSYFVYNDTSNALTWPFDQPQNIILNLAMGGGWGGLKGMDENVTSQQLVIDYVRVYDLQ